MKSRGMDVAGLDSHLSGAPYWGTPSDLVTVSVFMAAKAAVVTLLSSYRYVYSAKRGAGQRQEALAGTL